MIKGATKVAKESQKIVPGSWGKPFAIYWDSEKQMVTTKETNYFITHLIRPNTAEDIDYIVRKFLWL